MMKKVSWICCEIQTFWVKNVVVMVRSRCFYRIYSSLGFGDYYLHTMLYTYFKHSLSSDEKLFPLPHWIFHSRKCCSMEGELEPTFLCFRTFNTELDYWKQPDSQFKYYVACSAILFIILAVVQISLIPM